MTHTRSKAGALRRSLVNRETSERATDRDDGGVIDIHAVDHAHRSGRHADGKGALADLFGEAAALTGRQLLRVVDTVDGAFIGRHDHGARDNGAREGAPSHFIHAGDKRADGTPQLPLDRAPPCPATPAAEHRSYSAVPVSGTTMRTFFSLMRVALPVTWRRK